ncbi:MAG TPA: YciI family protein [Opitutaceae bacterium]
MKSNNLIKFLCLVYFEGKKFHAMTATERAAFDRDSYAYDMKLKKAGYWITAEALQSPKSSRLVSKRGRKVIVGGGPFVETKEALGGFILVKAKNLRHAEKIAGGIPLARLGWIEVRPIFDFR